MPVADRSLSADPPNSTPSWDGHAAERGSLGHVTKDSNSEGSEDTRKMKRERMEQTNTPILNDVTLATMTFEENASDAPREMWWWQTLPSLIDFMQSTSFYTLSTQAARSLHAKTLVPLEVLLLCLGMNTLNLRNRRSNTAQWRTKRKVGTKADDHRMEGVVRGRGVLSSEDDFSSLSLLTNSADSNEGTGTPVTLQLDQSLSTIGYDEQHTLVTLKHFIIVDLNLSLTPSNFIIHPKGRLLACSVGVVSLSSVAIADNENVFSDSVILQIHLSEPTVSPR
ncbi:hypothetical protein BLNAU_24119 [Blattamonas nauphoetae]|uniref:Uncharacterized protein n=1 Tax=Blattamonas nauphoetae TaxID=2049346 RepID=A0ABQ9WNB1_9EUKA|nr:hypothetical protein BLNAU_24265 [Blattamonas nauphoetae]KAK2940971.1 hypothetical protein BLNAU_24119 [Blattamonas nauphoetae]